MRHKQGKKEAHICTFFAALYSWNVAQLRQTRLLLHIRLPQPSSRRGALRLWSGYHQWSYTVSTAACHFFPLLLCLKGD